MKPSEQRAELRKRLDWFLWDTSTAEEREKMMMPDYNTIVIHPEANINFELGLAIEDLMDNFDWSRQDIDDWLDSFDRKPQVKV